MTESFDELYSYIFLGEIYHQNGKKYTFILLSFTLLAFTQISQFFPFFFKSETVIST